MCVTVVCYAWLALTSELAVHCNNARIYFWSVFSTIIIDHMFELLLSITFQTCNKPFIHILYLKLLTFKVLMFSPFVANKLKPKHIFHPCNLYVCKNASGMQQLSP